MSPQSNSPFDSSTSTPNQGGSSSPTATDLFRANAAANERHVGPTVHAPTVAGYQPSGRVGALGVPLLLLALLVVPIVCAFLYEKLWHFGSLVVFSEMLLGLLVGGAMNRVVHWGKVRNVPLAIIVGALVGLATVALSMGLEAWSARPEYVEGYTQYVVKAKKVSPQHAKVLVEKRLDPLFMTKIYWLDRADAGDTLTDSGSSSHVGDSHVSGATFWGLHAFEGLLVVIFGAALAGATANSRFSEEFDRWYISKNLYNVHPRYARALIDAAEAGDWKGCQAAARYPAEKNQVGARVICDYVPEKPGAILSIKAVANTRKGLQTVFERELNNEDIKTLWPGFPMPNTTAQPFLP